MFTLTIATDNAAFEADGPGEVARILRQVAATLLRATAPDGAGFPSADCMDGNGNSVGYWEYRS